MSEIHLGSDEELLTEGDKGGARFMLRWLWTRVRSASEATSDTSPAMTAAAAIIARRLAWAPEQSTDEPKRDFPLTERAPKKKDRQTYCYPIFTFDSEHIEAGCLRRQSGAPSNRSDFEARHCDGYIKVFPFSAFSLHNRHARAALHNLSWVLREHLSNLSKLVLSRWAH